MQKPLIFIFICSLLILQASSQNFDIDMTFNHTKIPYKWGQMKRYHQILKNVTKDIHYNETQEYEFDYGGYRTTFSMEIQDYEGKGPNPCEITPRSVDIEFDRLDASINPKNIEYLAMHSFNNILVTLNAEFNLQVFYIKSEYVFYKGLDIYLLDQIKIDPQTLSPYIPGSQNLIISNSHNGKLVHILLPSTMLTFEMVRIEDIQSFKIKLFKNSDYRVRKEISAAQFSNGYLFVSVDEDGIDVYQVQNEISVNYYFIKNLNQNSLSLPYFLNAVDLATDHSHRLYIVCPNNGVIIYFVYENAFEKSGIVHTISNLKNSTKIAVRGDHTLVVIGDDVERSYVTEIFYDIETNDYFINRYFTSTEYTWTDVQMGELFTFIQGRGYHKILYQGINKELVPQADKHSDFLNGIALQEIDQYDVKQVQSVYKGATSFIAITDNSIYGIELQEIPPKLVCRADQKSQIGESNMRLVFNSTDCNLATYHSPILYNVWQMCQTDFNFKLVVHDIWIDGQNVSVAGLIAVIVILIFIILIMVFAYLFNKYKQRFSKTESELLDIKQKYHVLETASSKNKDTTVMQDKSNLQFNNNNQLDTSALR
ncbi:transmembrane protein, putative (macronuclear) [Tetrahymena thermophila SB210]|uniref:Transmembrane protein, putative n=1 Tax=Tetrahymena thermophila (strain SB210) TaxID=312017 RepID=Q23JA3_TETTS|nr:transmembrane protein, putative [Tetrahymena thermophila SB210]EAR96601.3 transmembrane protein, putative [Tetrahymena thermophila SB210]|eukprot:XP_001016846.3 transmembrane protein, putative [Tetrahymena thermophila SB210]